MPTAPPRAANEGTAAAERQAGEPRGEPRTTLPRSTVRGGGDEVGATVGGGTTPPSFHGPMPATPRKPAPGAPGVPRCAAAAAAADLAAVGCGGGEHARAAAAAAAASGDAAAPPRTAEGEVGGERLPYGGALVGNWYDAAYG